MSRFINKLVRRVRSCISFSVTGTVTTSIIITSSILFTLSARAQSKADCPTLGVADTAFGTPPAVQPAQMCYATVAVDLISKEIDTRISTIAFANRSERAEDGPREFLRAHVYGPKYAYYRFPSFGRPLASSIEANLKLPFCKSSFLDTFNDKEIVDVFTTLENLRDVKSRDTFAFMKKFFDGLKPGFAERLFAESAQKRPLIDIAVDLSCENIATTTTIKKEKVNLIDRPVSQAIPIIETILRQGKAIAIGYDFYALSMGKVPVRERAQHASILLSQIWNENTSQCEYHVRMTDLASCAYVAPPNVCRDGIVITSRSRFSQAISDLTWLH